MGIKIEHLGKRFGNFAALDDVSLDIRQGELLAAGYPLLLGWSRKSSIGAALADPDGVPRPPAGRVAGSVATALLAAERGARILRVHDVRETADALKVLAQVVRPPA